MQVQTRTSKTLEIIGEQQPLTICIGTESLSSTPFDYCWNKILSANVDKRTEQGLRSLFPNQSELEERNFSKLHAIVLDLSLGNLGPELEAHESTVDARDSMGRTALHVSRISIAFLERSSDPCRPSHLAFDRFW